jgi:hypothetical protein
MKRSIPLVLVAALALLGAGSMVYATRWGPWAGTDSVEYIDAARNLAAGRGPVLVRASGRIVPLYLRPPMYPILLAGPIALGWPAAHAGRLIAVGLFAAVAAAPGALAGLAKNHGLLAPAVGAYLLAAPGMAYYSAGLMSESLFIVLVFAAVALAVAALGGDKPWFLVPAAIAAGLAWLTRYAGVASVVMVGLLPLLDPRPHLRSALTRAFLLLLIGSVPVALWTIYVRTWGYTPGVYALPGGDFWRELQPIRVAYVGAIWDWLPFGILLPAATYRAKAIILLAFFAGVAWAVVRALRSRNLPLTGGGPRSGVLAAGLLLAGFSATHLMVVAVSFLLVVLPQPALDARVLLPSQVTLVPGLALIAYALAYDLRPPVARLALPLALLVPPTVGGAPATWEAVARLHQDGQGYTSRAWHAAPILDALRGVPPSLAIVSNDIEAVTFHAGRPAMALAELDRPRPASQWTAFGQDPASEPERLFSQGKAALVLFQEGLPQLERLYGSRAPERLRAMVEGLVVLYRGPDGGIYLAGDPE